MTSQNFNITKSFCENLYLNHIENKQVIYTFQTPLTIDGYTKDELKIYSHEELIKQQLGISDTTRDQMISDRVHYVLNKLNIYTTRRIFNGFVALFKNQIQSHHKDIKYFIDNVGLRYRKGVDLFTSYTEPIKNKWIYGKITHKRDPVKSNNTNNDNKNNHINNTNNIINSQFDNVVDLVDLPELEYDDNDTMDDIIGRSLFSENILPSLEDEETPHSTNNQNVSNYNMQDMNDDEFLMSGRQTISNDKNELANDDEDILLSEDDTEETISEHDEMSNSSMSYNEITNRSMMSDDSDISYREDIDDKNDQQKYSTVLYIDEVKSDENYFIFNDLILTPEELLQIVSNDQFKFDYLDKSMTRSNWLQCMDICHILSEINDIELKNGHSNSVFNDGNSNVFNNGNNTNINNVFNSNISNNINNTNINSNNNNYNNKNIFHQIYTKIYQHCYNSYHVFEKYKQIPLDLAWLLIELGMAARGWSGYNCDNLPTDEVSAAQSKINDELIHHLVLVIHNEYSRYLDLMCVNLTGSVTSTLKHNIQSLTTTCTRSVSNDLLATGIAILQSQSSLPVRFNNIKHVMYDEFEAKSAVRFDKDFGVPNINGEYITLGDLLIGKLGLNWFSQRWTCMNLDDKDSPKYWYLFMPIFHQMVMDENITDTAFTLEGEFNFMKMCRFILFNYEYNYLEIAESKECDVDISKLGDINEEFNQWFDENNVDIGDAGLGLISSNTRLKYINDRIMNPSIILNGEVAPIDFMINHDIVYQSPHILHNMFPMYTQISFMIANDLGLTTLDIYTATDEKLLYIIDQKFHHNELKFNFIESVRRNIEYNMSYAFEDSDIMNVYKQALIDIDMDKPYHDLIYLLLDYIITKDLYNMY